jgi:hypothetical protein
MSLGAEAPLLQEHKLTFKELVVSQAPRYAVLNEAFVLFPGTRGRAKLLAGPEIPLLPEGGLRSFELYASAVNLNALVSESIDEFNRLARFSATLR